MKPNFIQISEMPRSIHRPNSINYIVTKDNMDDNTIKGICKNDDVTAELTSLKEIKEGKRYVIVDVQNNVLIHAIKRVDFKNNQITLSNQNPKFNDEILSLCQVKELYSIYLIGKP